MPTQKRSRRKQYTQDAIDEAQKVVHFELARLVHRTTSYHAETHLACQGWLDEIFRTQDDSVISAAAMALSSLTDLAFFKSDQYRQSLVEAKALEAKVAQPPKRRAK